MKQCRRGRRVGHPRRNEGDAHEAAAAVRVDDLGWSRNTRPRGATVRASQSRQGAFACQVKADETRNFKKASI
jgi:hypothetical protein